jgi:hypothetical protein
MRSKGEACALRQEDLEHLKPRLVALKEETP